MRSATFSSGLRLSYSTVVVVILSLLAASCTEPPPPPEVVMESDDPVTPFIGTWDLVDWRIVDPSGEVVFPWGEDPRGQLIYTRTGRMSAHLMTAPPESENGSGPGAGEDGGDGTEDGGVRQDLSYWGSFIVDPDARTVTHRVTGSSASSWVGSNQVRGFEFLGEDRLLLTAPQGSSAGGQGAPHRLTWVRVRPPAR